MPRPNFFIAGAPKCGTTALSEYLRANPQVFVSDPKEPHYFASDFDRLRVVDTERAYEKLFDDASPQHRAIGEASTGYLYSAVALERIKAYAPGARLIAMLRNPVDLAYSWHSQRLYATDETVEDFETAWRLQDERRRGESIPAQCRHVEFLYYRDVALLGAQVARMGALFPAEQIHTVLFDDLEASPRQVYVDTLRFLGVDDDGRDTFPRINEARAHRHPLIGRLTQNPPAPIRAAVRTAKRVLGIGRLGLLDPLRKWNAAPKTRAPLSAEFREELREAFRDDIEQLEAVIGRDLSAWK